MTKIGEGASPAEEPTVQNYKNDLEDSSNKFLKALEQYNSSPNADQQEHLRTIMDQQMGLIQSALSELNKHGIHKGGTTVAKDYLDFKEEETTENYTCLHNDVETLRDLNKTI